MRNKIHFKTGYGLAPIDYYSTLRALRINQFEVTIAQTQWSDTFEGLLTKTRQEISRTPGDHPTIVGHGVGGNLVMRAIAGEERSMGGLVLASPGVMCAEARTIPGAKEAFDELFPDLYQQDQISRYSIEELARYTRLRPSQVAVLVGEREMEAHPYAGQIAEITADAFRTDVIVVPEAPYLVELSPQYIDTIVGASLRIHEAGRGL